MELVWPTSRLGLSHFLSSVIYLLILLFSLPSPFPVFPSPHENLFFSDHFPWGVTSDHLPNRRARAEALELRLVDCRSLLC